MTQNFNLKRALLLSKSIILINKKIIIVGAMICFGIMLICSIMDVNVSYGAKYDFMPTLSFQVITITALMLLPKIMFKEYQDKMPINTSYMLPASTNEKFFVPFIISLIFVPIILYTLYIITFSLSWVLSHAINSNTAEYAAIINKDFFFFQSPIIYFSSLAYYHSFGFLMLNPKNAKLQILALISMIMYIPIDYAIHNLQNYGVDNEIIKCIILCVVAILFWIVSYINFKRIETTNDITYSMIINQYIFKS